MVRLVTTASGKNEMNEDVGDGEGGRGREAEKNRGGERERERDVLTRREMGDSTHVLFSDIQRNG